MEVPLSTEICRCCLAPGNYKSLKDTFQWMGQNENYGDMLKECFNVTLCDANDSCHGGICELCITQLRNARNFKKQVLKSDEIFKQGLDNNFKGEEVKIEFLNENDLDSDTGNQDDYFAGLETEEETEVPVKEEITVATKSRKRTVERKVPVKNDAPAKKKKPEGETSGKGEILKNSENSTNLTDRRKQLLEEKLRRYRNLIALLELTNATPLKNKSDRGFHCAYCLETFLEPAELKAHVLKDHGDIKLKYNHLRKLLHWDSIKMDITDLQCNICNSQMRELTDLHEHINKAHGKDLKSNKDRIIPFRFDDPESMKCAVCFQTFVSFNMLLRHMNIHYRNYVCVECQAGFVAERLLKYHIKQSHAQGEFQCSSCEKVFSTMTKKRDHERAVHCGFKRNKCPYCPERFMSHVQRSSHIVKFHGKHSVLYKCNGCEKSFDSRKNLTQHVRAYHLMEKMHACTQCDKSFFRKICLDNHMLKHTGEKRYVCDICSKSYGRKFTLREHMRIHNNDRRFKCEECSQAFVQKCSWRSHMRTRHNITV